MNLLWTQPCSVLYGTAWRDTARFANFAMRMSTGGLLIQNTITPFENPITIRAEWIVDIQSARRLFHYEGCGARRFHNEYPHSIYINYQNRLWGHEFPHKPIDELTLSLRIGGYLVDRWDLGQAVIHNVVGSLNFTLSTYSKLKKPAKRMGYLVHPIRVFIEDENICCELPTGDGNGTVLFGFRPDQELWRTAHQRIPQYRLRYQDFLLDMLKSETGFCRP